MSRVLKYNPQPLTVVYRVAVFNPSGHGVAEFETLPGLSMDARIDAAQRISDAIPEGYTVQVFEGVYTLGRTVAGNRRITWN